MMLSDLKPNQKAVIRCFEGPGPLHERLMELGVVPGTEIFVKRFAPFGDPMEVVVRGASFSIRKRDAQRIRVTVGGGKP